MSSDQVVITVRDISKTYIAFKHPLYALISRFSGGYIGRHKEFHALRNVSLQINRGETIGIIGRNGSGKSTLLQIICGIRKATHGTVDVNGRISALLELGAGFHPEFTGRENVFMQGAIMGISRAEMEGRFDAIAEFADIGEFIDQPVKNYSSGMFVRLAFATSINVDPDILFVDEALAVGDASFRARCHAKFDEFKSNGKTIVFVTHDLNQVVTHCDRAILLDRSKIVATGRPKDVVDRYRQLLGQPSESVANHKTDACRGNWSGLFQLNIDEIRYGDRQHEIIEAGIFAGDEQPAQVIKHGEKITIRIRIAHHSHRSLPFVSFVIKDIRGQPVTGSTTEWEGIEAPLAPNKEASEASFTLPVLLNPGHYLLSLGLQSRPVQGETIAHDHRTDYLIFEVIGHQRHGIFSSPLESQWI